MFVCPHSPVPPFLGPGEMDRQTDRQMAAPHSGHGRGMLAERVRAPPPPALPEATSPAHCILAAGNRGPLAVPFTRKEMGWRAEEF